MPLDPATDYLKFTFPTPRAITMVSVRPSNLPNVTTAVSWSQRGGVNYKVRQMCNGAYVDPECSYLLSKHADTNGAGPWKPGDTLTDANEQDPTQQTPTPVTYTVLRALADPYYWLLAVINPKICFNLRDTVDVVLKTQSVSTILTRQTTDSDVATGVVCRRQPTDVRMAVMMGRQDNDKMYDVFFASNFDLLPDRHVLRWTEGAATIIADVLSVTNAQRIDELMRATVRVA